MSLINTFYVREVNVRANNDQLQFGRIMDKYGVNGVAFETLFLFSTVICL